MGDWHISIQGTGCHHNGNPAIDADLATAEFVQKLLGQGHSLICANFTTGGRYDMLGGVGVLIDSGRYCRRVFVNGRQFAVGQKLSYEDILVLAGKTGNPSVTVSYGSNAGGRCMIAGDTLDVNDGYSISCVHTGNA